MDQKLEAFPIAIDHALRPRNPGPLAHAHGHAVLDEPGRRAELWLSIGEGRIERVAFRSAGSEALRACLSMTTLLAVGRKVEEASALRADELLTALALPSEGWREEAAAAVRALSAACNASASSSPPDARAPGCASCTASACSAKAPKEGESSQAFEERQRLARRLCRIKHKVLVLSGKGGVGKSTVAVNLAATLAGGGKRVGILDVDIHGPSVPTMLGLEGAAIRVGAEGMLPVEKDGLRVMSIGFLAEAPDDPIIWRGPRKMGAIKQFLADVEWGELDYLVIDAPPGTGDEPLSVCQLVDGADGAVIVTTPQQVSVGPVRRCVNFCRRLELPVLGLVENMSGFVCPRCGELTRIFAHGGGERMARDMEVPFLGALPIDPAIGEACDEGRPYVQTHVDERSAALFARVFQPIVEMSGIARD
ncbi:MAG: P-loop NTPase [Myxococcales bacterium]|jgi:ATP-binding protein involved in chromosome partitioning